MEEAARRTEEELGPIDVWVNDAFTSPFGKFTDISPEGGAGGRTGQRGPTGAGGPAAAATSCEPVTRFQFVADHPPPAGLPVPA
ncbi:hypothetical protein [Streptomyces avermitilis]|uniref:hypothetical protein n=1 Tax=Streptomyces avermitilis TaxID=33903 RepID=UPI003690AC70